eukprot:gnl/Chilomastix_cuspidata/1181.p1 GENE.gnl/Chilomastix_cuspidata/1181~~gnl/Chilomastix_cuspidata/1181.p1  ORF type:complete len:390 (-),score=108.71 gnl/Chilomastix_cuspidata/1181:70-1239(-)
MHIFFVGCVHGLFNQVYQRVDEHLEKGNEIDLVVIAGDLQTFRRENDMQSSSLPLKYRKLGDFPDYFFGRKRAPVPTLLIHGNHENSDYLAQLPLGGYIAPNMFYLGRYGAVVFSVTRGGVRESVRFVGLSGIDYPGSRTRPMSNPPFRRMGDVRTAYHIRDFEYTAFEMLLAAAAEESVGPDPTPTVVLTHDWPAGVLRHPSHGSRVARRFQVEMRKKGPECVGSVGYAASLRGALARFRPIARAPPPLRMWVAAHHHHKFRATLPVPSFGVLDPERPLMMTEREITGVFTPVEFLALGKVGQFDWGELHDVRGARHAEGGPGADGFALDRIFASVITGEERTEHIAVPDVGFVPHEGHFAGNPQHLAIVRALGIPNPLPWREGPGAH